MSEAKYDLVINGMPKGADAKALKKHISTVCKLAPAAVDMAIGELIAGVRQAVLVRKHLPQSVAEELKAALESKGLLCALVAPLGLVAREVTVEKKEYVCPACDHRQPYTDVQDDAPCANCGVIRSKYLKNEQTRKANGGCANSRRRTRLSSTCATRTHEIKKRSKRGRGSSLDGSAEPTASIAWRRVCGVLAYQRGPQA
jgi:hypothetical protein